MTHKVYFVIDLGPGDGGKGGVVHKICTMTRVHTVIKVGGGQGSHGVHTSRGEAANFSHWGCGTFEGIRTHLSSRMVVLPEGALNEAAFLSYKWGIHNAFDLLTIDSEALCATPYHRIASRVKELSRGSNPRGTIGTGAGEAYRDQLLRPDLTIQAGNLADADIRDRLAAVRDHTIQDLEKVVHGEFLAGDHCLLEHELDLLHDDGFLDYVTRRFQSFAQQASVVSPSYLGEEILTQSGAAVIESSHGVLTDCYAGFHPHTSALRTLPRFTHTMLEAAGYTGQTATLGVTRAYAVRHGAGPLPTSDSSLTEALLPGSHKDDNRFQGSVRVGPLDLVLLRYAITACGGPSAFSGLAVSWFDQIQANQAWHICNRYTNATHPDFFTPTGEIKFRDGWGNEQLNHQAALTQCLFECKPEIETLVPPLAADRDTQYSFCADRLGSDTGIPVRMVSFGPTELDKLCK